MCPLARPTVRALLIKPRRTRLAVLRSHPPRRAVLTESVCRDFAMRQAVAIRQDSSTLWSSATVLGPSTVAGLGINPALEVHLRRLNWTGRLCRWRAGERSATQTSSAQRLQAPCDPLCSTAAGRQGAQLPAEFSYVPEDLMACEATVADLAAVHAEHLKATTGRGQGRKIGGCEIGRERARKAKIAGDHVSTRSHPLLQLLEMKVWYAGKGTTDMFLDGCATVHEG
jgi:hypothetical protein